MTEPQLHTIRDRQLSSSMTLKAKHYDEDTSVLLAAWQDLKNAQQLTEDERRELAELRELKKKVVNFVFTCGIPLGPIG